MSENDTTLFASDKRGNKVPVGIKMERGILAPMKKNLKDIVLVGGVDSSGNIHPALLGEGLCFLFKMSHQKWEYKFVGIDAATGTTDDAEESFSELGEEGWELIHVTSTSLGYLFKRPKVEAES